MWYDLNDEAGLYLDSNTKYYWQCYAIVNGKEYKGEIKSFTTLNSLKPIKSIVCNSTVMKSTKKDVSYIIYTTHLFDITLNIYELFLNYLI